MQSYESEQARLAKMMEEILDVDEEGNNIVYDDEDEGEIDNLEVQLENSDTEEELSDDGELDYDSSGDRLHFLGKDKKTKWNKMVPKKSVRTRSENLIKHLPGVKPVAKILKLPVDIWKHFWTDEMLNIIVDSTNLSIQEIQHKYSRERDCKFTDKIEIQALIGLLYFAGVLKSSRLNAEDLWRNDATGVELFRLTMSLTRFRFLLRHFRFDNKSTRDERLKFDNLAAIRNVFDLFVDHCKTAFTPFEYLTIDEKLEAFRGNCRFRQYIPSKPNKYGIKIFALCDSKMFYTLDLEVYVGKQPDGPFQVSNSPAAVVERLCQCVKGSSRNITVDNWFTSIDLIRNLKKNFKLTLVGTIRKNKKELPPEILQPRNKHIGSSMFGFNETCTIVSYVPRKSRIVLLASSLHHDDEINPQTGKPEIIMMYNATKGGVDTVDKLCSTYDCARNTRRWPMVIFYSLLNVAAINSLVIFSANNPEINIPRREFLRQLSFELVKEHAIFRISVPNIDKALSSRIAQVFHVQMPTRSTEERVNQRGRCAYCDRKKNRPIKYSCKKCVKFMCLEHANFICGECLEGYETT